MLMLLLKDIHLEKKTMAAKRIIEQRSLEVKRTFYKQNLLLKYLSLSCFLTYQWTSIQFNHQMIKVRQKRILYRISVKENSVSNHLVSIIFLIISYQANQ